jgi:hypothetical protein
MEPKKRPELNLTNYIINSIFKLEMVYTNKDGKNTHPAKIVAPIDDLTDYIDFFEKTPFTTDKGKITYKFKYLSIKKMIEIDKYQVIRGRRILTYLLNNLCGDNASDFKKQIYLESCKNKEMSQPFHIVASSRITPPINSGFIQLLLNFLEKNNKKYNCYNIILTKDPKCFEFIPDIEVLPNPSVVEHTEKADDSSTTEHKLEINVTDKSGGSKKIKKTIHIKKYKTKKYKTKKYKTKKYKTKKYKTKKYKI